MQDTSLYGIFLRLDSNYQMYVTYIYIIPIEIAAFTHFIGS